MAAEATNNTAAAAGGDGGGGGEIAHNGDRNARWDHTCVSFTAKDSAGQQQQQQQWHHHHQQQHHWQQQQQLDGKYLHFSRSPGQHSKLPHGGTCLDEIVAAQQPAAAEAAATALVASFAGPSQSPHQHRPSSSAVSLGNSPFLVPRWADGSELGAALAVDVAAAGAAAGVAVVGQGNGRARCESAIQGRVRSVGVGDYSVAGEECFEEGRSWRDGVLMPCASDISDVPENSYRPAWAPPGLVLPDRAAAAGGGGGAGGGNSSAAGSCSRSRGAAVLGPPCTPKSHHWAGSDVGASAAPASPLIEAHRVTARSAVAAAQANMSGMYPAVVGSAAAVGSPAAVAPSPDAFERATGGSTSSSYRATTRGSRPLPVVWLNPSSAPCVVGVAAAPEVEACLDDVHPAVASARLSVQANIDQGAQSRTAVPSSSSSAAAAVARRLYSSFAGPQGPQAMAAEEGARAGAVVEAARDIQGPGGVAELGGWFVIGRGRARPWGLAGPPKGPWKPAGMLEQSDPGVGGLSPRRGAKSQKQYSCGSSSIGSRRGRGAGLAARGVEAGGRQQQQLVEVHAKYAAVDRAAAVERREREEGIRARFENESIKVQRLLGMLEGEMGVEGGVLCGQEIGEGEEEVNGAALLGSVALGGQQQRQHQQGEQQHKQQQPQQLEVHAKYAALHRAAAAQRRERQKEREAQLEHEKTQTQRLLAMLEEGGLLCRQEDGREEKGLGEATSLCPLQQQQQLQEQQQRLRLSSNSGSFQQQEVISLQEEEADVVLETAVASLSGEEDRGLASRGNRGRVDLDTAHYQERGISAILSKQQHEEAPGSQKGVRKAQERLRKAVAALAGSRERAATRVQEPSGLVVRSQHLSGLAVKDADLRSQGIRRECERLVATAEGGGRAAGKAAVIPPRSAAATVAVGATANWPGPWIDCSSRVKGLVGEGKLPTASAGMHSKGPRSNSTTLKLSEWRDAMVAERGRRCGRASMVRSVSQPAGDMQALLLAAVAREQLVMAALEAADALRDAEQQQLVGLAGARALKQQEQQQQGVEDVGSHDALLTILQLQREQQQKGNWLPVFSHRTQEEKEQQQQEQQCEAKQQQCQRLSNEQHKWGQQPASDEGPTLSAKEALASATTAAAATRDCSDPGGIMGAGASDKVVNASSSTVSLELSSTKQHVAGLVREIEQLLKQLHEHLPGTEGAADATAPPPAAAATLAGAAVAAAGPDASGAVGAAAAAAGNVGTLRSKVVEIQDEEQHTQDRKEQGPQQQQQHHQQQWGQQQQLVDRKEQGFRESRSSVRGSSGGAAGSFEQHVGELLQQVQEEGSFGQDMAQALDAYLAEVEQPKAHSSTRSVNGLVFSSGRVHNAAAAAGGEGAAFGSNGAAVEQIVQLQPSGSGVYVGIANGTAAPRSASMEDVEPFGSRETVGSGEAVVPDAMTAAGAAAAAAGRRAVGGGSSLTGAAAGGLAVCSGDSSSSSSYPSPAAAAAAAVAAALSMLAMSPSMAPVKPVTTARDVRAPFAPWWSSQEGMAAKTEVTGAVREEAATAATAVQPVPAVMSEGAVVAGAAAAGATAEPRVFWRPKKRGPTLRLRSRSPDAAALGSGTRSLAAGHIAAAAAEGMGAGAGSSISCSQHVDEAAPRPPPSHGLSRSFKRPASTPRAKEAANLAGGYDTSHGCVLAPSAVTRAAAPGPGNSAVGGAVFNSDYSKNLAWVSAAKGTIPSAVGIDDADPEEIMYWADGRQVMQGSSFQEQQCGHTRSPQKPELEDDLPQAIGFEEEDMHERQQQGHVAVAVADVKNAEHSMLQQVDGELGACKGVTGGIIMQQMPQAVMVAVAAGAGAVARHSSGGWSKENLRRLGVLGLAYSSNRKAAEQQIEELWLQQLQEEVLWEEEESQEVAGTVKLGLQEQEQGGQVQLVALGDSAAELGCEQEQEQLPTVLEEPRTSDYEELFQYMSERELHQMLEEEQQREVQQEQEREDRTQQQQEAAVGEKVVWLKMQEERREQGQGQKGNSLPEGQQQQHGEELEQQLGAVEGFQERQLELGPKQHVLAQDLQDFYNQGLLGADAEGGSNGVIEGVTEGVELSVASLTDVAEGGSSSESLAMSMIAGVRSSSLGSRGSKAVRWQDGLEALEQLALGVEEGEGLEKAASMGEDNREGVVQAE